MLPTDPILGYWIRDLARRMADRHGGNPRYHERTLYRIRSRGRLTPRMADRVAIALGTHPLLMWGDAWLMGLGASPIDVRDEKRSTR